MRRTPGTFGATGLTLALLACGSPAPQDAGASSEGSAQQTLAYTRALETLRVEADGRLTLLARPEAEPPFELRSLALHPSRRWLAAAARRGLGAWDHVVFVPLDGHGLPDVRGLRALAVPALPDEARSPAPYSGSRGRDGLLAIAFAPDGGTLFVARARFLPPYFDCHGPAALTAHAFDVASAGLGPAGPAVSTLTDPVALLPDAAGQIYALAVGDPTQLYGPCGQGGVAAHGLGAAGALSAGVPLTVDHEILGTARGGSQFLFLRRYYDPHTDLAGTRLLAFAPSAEGGFVASGSRDFPSLYALGGPAADGAGRFAYVIDRGRLAGYAIGSFAPLPGTPVDEAEAVSGELFVSPDSRFLYARPASASGASRVHGYRLDPTSGQPRPLAGSPFLAGESLDGGWVFARYP